MSEQILLQPIAGLRYIDKAQESLEKARIAHERYSHHDSKTSDLQDAIEYYMSTRLSMTHLCRKRTTGSRL